MKRIYKYPLQITDMQTITVPLGTRILKVADQGGTLTAWALVVDEPESQAIDFRVVGTGHDIDDAILGSFAYLDSVVMAAGAMVWHVFVR